MKNGEEQPGSIKRASADVPRLRDAWQDALEDLWVKGDWPKHVT